MQYYIYEKNLDTWLNVKWRHSIDHCKSCFWFCGVLVVHSIWKLLLLSLLHITIEVNTLLNSLPNTIMNVYICMYSFPVHYIGTRPGIRTVILLTNICISPPHPFFTMQVRIFYLARNMNCCPSPETYIYPYSTDFASQVHYICNLVRHMKCPTPDRYIHAPPPRPCTQPFDQNNRLMFG